MGGPPEFDRWKDSVFTTNDGAAGALTFLWHLRALLTGNEDSSFLGGSFFFPLVGGANQGSPPVLGAGPIPSYQPGPNDTGAWFGIADEANKFSLVLDMRRAGQVCPRLTLAQVTGGDFTRPSIPETQWNQIKTFLQNVPQTGLPIGGTEKITPDPDGSAWRITLLNQTLSDTNVQGFDGVHKLQLFLQKDKPISYRYLIEPPPPTSTLKLPLPPSTETAANKKVVGSIVSLVLNAFKPPNSAKGVVTALASFIEAELTGGNADAAVAAQIAD